MDWNFEVIYLLREIIVMICPFEDELFLSDSVIATSSLSSAIKIFIVCFDNNHETNLSKKMCGSL